MINRSFPENAGEQAQSPIPKELAVNAEEEFNLDFILNETLL